MAVTLQVMESVVTMTLKVSETASHRDCSSVKLQVSMTVVSVTLQVMEAVVTVTLKVIEFAGHRDCGNVSLQVSVTVVTVTFPQCPEGVVTG